MTTQDSHHRALNRVVVTGLGAVTPIGQTVDAFWDGLCAGVSGIAPLQSDDVGLTRLPVGQIQDFDVAARLGHWQRDRSILLSDRYSWLAAAAADEAIRHAGLSVPFSNPFRTACIIASGAGGQNSGERGCRNRFVLDKRAVHPFFFFHASSHPAQPPTSESNSGSRAPPLPS